MAHPTQVLYNTLEQVLSADVNRTGQLAGKAVLDALVALNGGIGGTPRDVVLRGLGLAPGAGVSVVLSAGSLLRFVVGAGVDESQYQMGALNADLTQAIVPDGVNPRIDLLSCAIPAAQDTDSTIRNVLTLPSRVVTPVAVNKTRRPTLTVTYTAGVAAATPAFPAVPAGELALWFVYVPAAAAAISADHLIDCRSSPEPYTQTLAHSRRTGAQASNGASQALSFIVTPGSVDVLGTRRFVSAQRTLTTAVALEPGTALLADTQYFIYAVAVGNGDAVGSTVPDGIVWVLSVTAPTDIGVPSVAISYNPLQTIAGVAAISRSTTKALAVAPIRTNGLPALEPYGSSTIDPGCRYAVGGLHALTGQEIAAWGFVKKPRVSWVSATQVRIGHSYLRINGWDLEWAPANADITANLASNDPAEGASIFYYVYLRLRVSSGAAGVRGRINSLVPIISREAPNERGFKPTAEAGFSLIDYLFVGSVYNNAASDFEPFYREGNRTIFRDRQSIATLGWAQAPAFTTLTVARCPATSRLAIVGFAIQGTNAGAGIGGTTFSIYHTTTAANPGFQGQVQCGEMASVSVALGHVDFLMDVELDASNQFRANVVDSSLIGTCGHMSVGYVEEIGEHAF